MASTHIVGVDGEGLVYYGFGGEKIILKCLVSQEDLQAELGVNSCWVCSSPSNGIHFKAVSCAACNAFFRRSIASRRVYLCRKNGDCEISKNVRCLCRACRLKKCVFVGMDAKVVQPQRGQMSENDGVTVKKEVLKKTIKIENKTSPCSEDSTMRSDCESVLSLKLLSDKSSPYNPESFKTCDSSPSTSSHSHFQFKIIDVGLTAYRKLLNRRRIIYTTTSLYDMMAGIEPPFRKHCSADHHRLESAQIRTWVTNAIEFFDSFAFLKELEVKERCNMFKEFLLNFISLEKYYLSYKMGGAVQNRIYCQDYVYIDLNELIETTNEKQETLSNPVKQSEIYATGRVKNDSIKASSLTHSDKPLSSTHLTKASSEFVGSLVDNIETVNAIENSLIQLGTSSQTADTSRTGVLDSTLKISEMPVDTIATSSVNKRLKTDSVGSVESNVSTKTSKNLKMDQMMDKTTTNKINLPDCIKAMELLVRPMHELQMDDTEFICCTVSIMFDTNIVNANPAIKELSKKVRNQLYQEWFHYYAALGYNHDEAAIRMGNALLIGPTLIEFVNHVKQNFHLMRVFGDSDDYDKVLNDIFMP
ncbi:unnamed protein product [Bursaphelenchus okinawaensis]|uniref:Nuclear receptor domain-containing protein n=1 Tax=Bursaphelenchus okinawaensis TaxID=465554 RepID=A0A811L108_9BILA|nr:unnamed protein product [Bursaphelenchus okinawaensis]CAG9114170.1 unnamed protein product [Bursaphelenchus okinawaensis]